MQMSDSSNGNLVDDQPPSFGCRPSRGSSWGYVEITSRNWDDWDTKDLEFFCLYYC